MKLTKTKENTQYIKKKQSTKKKKNAFTGTKMRKNLLQKQKYKKKCFFYLCSYTIKKSQTVGLYYFTSQLV